MAALASSACQQAESATSLTVCTCSTVERMYTQPSSRCCEFASSASSCQAADVCTHTYDLSASPVDASVQAYGSMSGHARGRLPSQVDLHTQFIKYFLCTSANRLRLLQIDSSTTPAPPQEQLLFPAGMQYSLRRCCVNAPGQISQRTRNSQEYRLQRRHQVFIGLAPPLSDRAAAGSPLLHTSSHSDSSTDISCSVAVPHDSTHCIAGTPLLEQFMSSYWLTPTCCNGS